MAAVLEASDQGRIIINGVHNAPLIKDANIPPPLPPQQDQPPSIDPHDHGASSQKRKGESASPPPPSAWTPRCHPRSAQVGPTVERYFLDNWPFPTPRARARFLTAGFSTVTCLYFPLARDDRIEYACRLLTLLFLIDDQLEGMSLEEGRAFNARLMPIMRGAVLPNRTAPAESISYDLWQAMRHQDETLADTVLEPTFVFMRAQTDKIRLHIRGFGPYFDYREKDVGKGLLSALMCFTMSLRPNAAELESLGRLERYCGRHISAVNDILSWEKEVRAAEASDGAEGAVLCSAVKVVMEETGVGVEAAKRVLWQVTREWEGVFEGLVGEMLRAGCGAAVRGYMQGLEYQMSGNEAWSLSTARYHDLG